MPPVAKKSGKRVDLPGMSDLMPIGVARFPNLVRPGEVGTYHAGKYTVTVMLEKGDPDNDKFAQMVNDYHKSVGGLGEVVKDGDKYKPEYNAGFHVVTLKHGAFKPPKIVDAKRNPVDAAEIDFGDTIRFSPVVFDYSDGRLAGCTLYFNWLQLLIKNEPSIPEYDGGYTVTDAPAKAQPSLYEDLEDDDVADEPPAPPAMTTDEVLSAVRTRSRAGRGAAASA